MDKKIVSALILILALTFVAALVTETNKLYLATILTNGTIQYSSNPITQVSVIGFKCLDNHCNNVLGKLWSQTFSTGSDNSVTLEYPEVKTVNNYGIYFYKDGYIPFEANSTWAGNGNAGTFNRYLGKMQKCSSEISSLQTTGNFQQDEPLTITAKINSPINHGGPLNYVPSEIADQYTVDVTINLVIKDNQNSIIYEQEKIENINFSATKQIQFSWTPTQAGNYKVEVITTVDDQKCLSDEEKNKINEITIDSLPECSNGATQQCSTGLAGICSSGTKTCVSNQWTSCVQNNQSRTENCNSLDDDCDGQIDEGNVCVIPECSTGQTQSCSTGLFGRCSSGIRSCVSGNWTSCVQINQPITEICSNLIDDDCDGLIDMFDTNDCAAPECTYDSQCPADTISAPYCSEGDVYYTSYDNYCSQAHTCSFTEASHLVQDCLFGCSAGICLNQTDTTAPTITVFSPQNTTYNTNSIKVNFTAQDAHLDKLWFFNGTKNISYTSPITLNLSNGIYTFKFYANDTYGNLANTIKTFTVNYTYDDDKDDDGYNNQTDCNDNNPFVHPGATEICNLIDDDCDGVIDEGNVCVIPDTTPPLITIISPQSQEDSSTIEIIIQTNERTDTWFNIGGQNVSIGNNSTYFTGTQYNLSEGNYTIIAYSRDLAGNWNSTSKPFIIKFCVEPTKKESSSHKSQEEFICGNLVCESILGENKLNCPEDCKDKIIVGTTDNNKTIELQASLKGKSDYFLATMIFVSFLILLLILAILMFLLKRK